MRRDGQPRWMILTGLVHDLGKILCLWGEPQWAVVGDTFATGCAFSNKNVFPEFFSANPDAKNPRFQTPNGVYTEGCGLDAVALSWGHDEYIYNVCKDYLPEEGLYMLRYHSFYPWHREGAYDQFATAKDRAMKEWVLKFNTYDLYTKSHSKPDEVALRPYYEDLIREFFPDNAVEYFVSYYDYYQPEAYIATTDTYIEKDAVVNDDIDRLRHAATSSLLSRRDVIIVASVSCIYGLGSPEAYYGMLLPLERGQKIGREQILRKLVEIQYERNDDDFGRGTFRVRGDIVEVYPSYEELGLRIELFGDEIDQLTTFDPLTGKVLRTLEQFDRFRKKQHQISTCYSKVPTLQFFPSFPANHHKEARARQISYRVLLTYFENL